MSPKLDLTGRRFGRLVVLEEAGRDAGGKTLWRCLCDCGAETSKRAGHLTSGHVKSCGCAARDYAADRLRTHGQAGTALHKRWETMLARVAANPGHPSYQNYKGRGITVCERWRTFENFAADMADGFLPELTLERINNDRGYEPGNVRWATTKEQSRNKRSSLAVTFRGVTMNASDWADSLGLRAPTLRHRIRRGWSIERALTEGVDPQILARLFGGQGRISDS